MEGSVANTSAQQLARRTEGTTVPLLGIHRLAPVVRLVAVRVHFPAPRHEPPSHATPASVFPKSARLDVIVYWHVLVIPVTLDPPGKPVRPLCLYTPTGSSYKPQALRAPQSPQREQP
jgi:hypothetical protein